MSELFRRNKGQMDGPWRQKADGSFRHIEADDVPNVLVPEPSTRPMTKVELQRIKDQLRQISEELKLIQSLTAKLQK